MRTSKSRVVAVLGTLDTKGPETEFIKREIEQRGETPLVIDTGVQGTPSFQADVPRENVARSAGTTIKTLRDTGDRGAGVTAMGAGAAAIVGDLYRTGQLAGVIGLGGSAGTSITAAAVRGLPVGLPKLIVSTMASGDVRAYVDIKDVTLMYSVVDVAGLNRVSREVLGNAAAAIAGMADHYRSRVDDPSSRPVIGASMFGVTTPAVTMAREYLESQGYEVLVFHATGAGGRAMEGLVEDGLIDGVLDVTTTEWADELVGGVLNAGPHRLEAMGHKGIPHVVAPGALDMVNFGTPESVPPKFKGRLFYQHNPQVTLMRTTAEENRELGRILGQKLSLGTGPVEVFLPLKGFSAIDREGQPFYDPKADESFRQGLETTLRHDIPVHHLEAHVNDELFALAMARRLDEMMRHAPPKRST